MKQLSQQAFQQARRFLLNEGRPVEQALFRYTFESGSAQDVLTALSAFQNADGGFGHALEPDSCTPSSSALATAIGLGHLKDLGCTVEQAQVRQATQFLRNTFDEQDKVWRIVAQDVADFPHAPWWHDPDNNFNYRINPRADIVRLLHHFSALVPTQWLSDLTEDTVSAIITDEMDGHALMCALRLAETPTLPAEAKERLIPRVTEVALQLVERDPAKWHEYMPQPLWFAPSPTSLLAQDLHDELQLNLDFIIDQQSAQGCWEPTWDWGGFYPDAWQQARRDWSSVLTLTTLIQLRDFGRYV
jgi:hypothetical protein